MYEAQESNSQKAGEQLLHSQKRIKEQFNKKLIPATSTKLKIGDNVLIENVYRGKKVKCSGSHSRTRSITSWV